MLTGRLEQLISDHWQGISDNVVRDIRRDPKTPRLGSLKEEDLRQWAHDIIRTFNAWPANDEESLARTYLAVGRRRHREAIPLHEVVQGHHILKRAIVEYARRNVFARNALDIYSEEELEHRVFFFFDWLMYYLVRGYEEAAGG
jgi:hypothetical protein